MPIWFELSVRVVADKRAANEALLRMQHTYRPDPKCFFLQDGHAEVAGRTLDLAKLSWPRAFRAIDADSFARPCVDTPLAGFEAQALPSFALPSFALPCLALPCLPLPCLALPFNTRPTLKIFILTPGPHTRHRINHSRPSNIADASQHGTEDRRQYPSALLYNLYGALGCNDHPRLRR